MRVAQSCSEAFANIFTGAQIRRRLAPYLLQISFQEIVTVMTPSCMRASVSRVALAAIASAVLLSANAALASQGPGSGMGTASPFTQLAMAVLVYGTSAVVVATGLIGAARRH
jgi:hypothetical protein